MIHYQRDNDTTETDSLETATPSEAGEPEDSASAEDDAGLDDAVLDELNPSLFSDLDEGLPDTPDEEVDFSDLANGPRAGGLRSPELADLSSPGEVDIEELPDDALRDSGIPADALLDPLEE
jgi:hypothetical protein